MRCAPHRGGNIKPPFVRTFFQMFRFDAKQVFLTWPRCSFEPEDILANVALNIGPTYEIAKWAICQEVHEDGYYHAHALLEFNKRFNSRNERVFDIDGHHPRIEKRRGTVDQAIEYIEKEGVFIKHWPKVTDSKWAMAREAQTAEEFWAVLNERCPKEVILNHERIEYYVRKRFKPEVPEYVPRFTEFKVHPQMEQWATDYLGDDSVS